MPQPVAKRRYCPTCGEFTIRPGDVACPVCGDPPARCYPTWVDVEVWGEGEEPDGPSPP